MGKNKKITPPEQRLPFHLPAAPSYALLAVILIFFAVIRLRLVNLPLERDEGEYAYAGSLILHGLAPYQLCYTMKLPGTALSYALIEALFGRSPAAIHLGLLFANSAAIVLIYFLARRLFASPAALVASASFALLSIEPSILGFAAHAAQFVALAALAGILLLLRAQESARLWPFFLSGLVLGVAFLMKQPGIFFILFAILWTLYSGWRRNLPLRPRILEPLVLLLGSILPFAATCLILWRMGIFSRFWLWTFSYALQYGSETPFSIGLRLLWSSGSSVIGSAPLIWLLAAAGLVALYRDPQTRPHFPFLASLLLFSFVAVCPGLYFRGHYFVMMFPAISLLCAAAIKAGSNLLLEFESTRAWSALPVAVFLFCLVISVGQQSNFLFTSDSPALFRSLYAGNPFAEALPISDYIKAHSSPQDRIAVIGSEPEIYFYSDRLSATGYIYMYPLTEVQPFASSMQRDMISEIKACHPRFVVFVDSPPSWLTRDKSDRTIFQWSGRYTSQYRLAGIVDILGDHTEYHWSDAATYQPRSLFRVYLYDRGP